MKKTTIVLIVSTILLIIVSIMGFLEIISKELSTNREDIKRIMFIVSKKGTVFFGCNKYPSCNYVSWYEPVQEKCPQCGGLLFKKITKSSKKLECENKACGFTKEMEEENV